MDSELIWKLWEHEEEQRIHLTSSINIPILAATLVGSGLAAVALSFPYSKSGTTVAFLIAVAVTVITLLAAALHIFEGLFVAEYKRFPSPLKLSKHFDYLVGLYQTSGGMPAAHAAFAEQFKERMLEILEHNRTTNYKRGMVSHVAIVSIALSLVALAVASGIYAVEKVSEPPTTYNVKITEE
jgi:hypothetical protein